MFTANLDFFNSPHKAVKSSSHRRLLLETIDILNRDVHRG
jgi:hypothetical protein